MWSAILYITGSRTLRGSTGIAPRQDLRGDGELPCRQLFNPLGIPQIWQSIVARVSHKGKGTMTSHRDSSSLSITLARTWRWIQPEEDGNWSIGFRGVQCCGGRLLIDLLHFELLVQ